HLATEFNRKPKADGSGSDHAPEGSGVSLISGFFNSFQMTGNVQVESSQSIYEGSWGLASKYANFNRPIQVNDVVATIAGSFFNVPDLVGKKLITNYQPLFDYQGRLIHPTEVKNNG